MSAAEIFMLSIEIVKVTFVSESVINDKCIALK